MTVQEAFEAAIAHHRAGRLDDAEVLYRSILAALPQHAPTLHLLGLVRFGRGDSQEGHALIRQAIDLDPSVADFHNNLGSIDQEMGRVDEAQRHFYRAIELKPDYPEAQYNLGLTLQHQGKLAEAEACYRRAIALRADYVSAHNNLGLVLVMQGKAQEGEVSFRRALELSPGHASAALNLGTSLVSRGRQEESISWFRRATELDPKDAEAWSSLGSALATQWQMEDAIASFHRALQARPDHLPALSGLAFALARVERLPEALGVARQAVSGYPDDADTHRTLANLLEKSGEVADAAAELRRAAELDRSRKASYDLAAVTGEEAPPAMPKEYVVELFDQFAPKFDEQLQALEYHIPQRLFEAVMETSPAVPMDVIDIGCGTGMSGAPFAGGGVIRSLVGIDLSPGMIERARERGIYTELDLDDVVAGLRKRPRSADVIIAADVFIYIGEMDEPMAAAVEALRPRGRLAFSLESLEDGHGYVLRKTRRYAQSLSYVRELAAKHGLRELVARATPVRKENHVDVPGWVVVLQKA